MRCRCQAARRAQVGAQHMSVLGSSTQHYPHALMHLHVELCLLSPQAKPRSTQYTSKPRARKLARWGLNL